MDIPFRSLQSEFSNLLALLPVLRGPKSSVRLLFGFPLLLHLYRYTKNFGSSLDLSKDQLPLWPLTLLDYGIIALHYYSDLPSLPLAILSGLLSFYFVRNLHSPTRPFVDPKIDLPMCGLLLYLLPSSNRDLSFFCIRDLVYHLLEICIYARK